MIRSGIAGCLLSLALTLPAIAQPSAPQISGTMATPAPSFVPPPAARQTLPKRPVFTVAGVPVYVWAPVPPPYDGRANRNGASNPLYLGNEYPPAPAPLS